jgi:hypothetical protein
MSKRCFVGLDLGQAQEFTALAVLEGTDTPPRSYAVRHLHRWPVGTAYPAIIAKMAKVVGKLPQGTALALDITMVGRPVVDLVCRAGLTCAYYPITLTSGHSVATGPIGPLVPKKELVSTLQVLLQARRLQVARTLPHAALLVAEMSNFKAKARLSADNPLEDWREGAHDDLVLAVALAAWLGENRIEPYTGPVVYWPPVSREFEEGGSSRLRQLLLDLDDDEADDPWWARPASGW